VTEHRVDITSLIAGIAFAAVGIAFLVGDLSSFADQTRYLWPGLLIVLGLALLLSGPRQHRAGDEVGAERGEDGEI
jgi:hypothetical protein